MKNLLLSLFITLLYNSALFSQINQRSRIKNYTVIKDHPEYANNFMFSVYPFLDKRTSNIRDLGIGFGGELFYSFKNRIALDFKIRNNLKEPYPENEFDGVNDVCTIDKSKQILLGTNITYFFKNIISEKMRNHRASMFNSNAVTAKMSSKVMYQFGVRVGYEYCSSIFLINYNGIDLKGIDINDVNKTIIIFPTSENALIKTYTHSVSLGFAFRRVSNFEIQIERRPKTGKYTKSSDYYFDITYAPSVTYSNINKIDSISSDNKTKYINTYDINSLAFSKMGFRLGANFYKLKTASLRLGAEVGAFPGGEHFFSRTYIIVKVGLNISANLFNKP